MGYVRLKDLFCKWLKPDKSTVKELSETIILEQFLRMVHPELEIWIREHNPKTAEEAARLAEVFTSARKGNRSATFGWENHQAHSSRSSGGEQGSGQPRGRGFSRDSQFTPQATSHAKKPSPRSSEEDVRCYYCNGLGHTKPFCPALSHTNPSLLCSAPTPATVSTVRDAGRTAPVLINGQHEIALLDSACFQTVVLSISVPREKWSEDKSQISCVHGDEHVYPTIDVYLIVEGQTFLLTVALPPTLPYTVILGNDVPTLYNLMTQLACKPDRSSDEGQGSVADFSEPPRDSVILPVKTCNVTTRAQSAGSGSGGGPQRASFLWGRLGGRAH